MVVCVLEMVAERPCAGSRVLEHTDRHAENTLRRGATLDKTSLIGRSNLSTMGNTYTSLHYHIIFSTKNREPWLRPDIQEQVWSYLGGIAGRHGFKTLLFGGIEDHVHGLLAVPPKTSVSEALQVLKGGSSGWIKQTIAGCRGFAWQDGYGAFSVSKSQLAGVEEYIRGQREHHRIKTFEEEYRAMLERHQIDFNQRYLLD